MAEIKSTMEMVLERAARMEKEATKTTAADYTKDGMRIAAAYMNGQNTDITTALNLQADEKKQTLRAGIIQILLRNIVLPRDEELMNNGKKAINGLLQLCEGQGDITSLCMELGQILEQYEQHKSQVTEQLKDALRNQLQQQQAMLGETAEVQDFNPASHPQYTQELSKMLTELNDQYNQAMDQRKDMIKQIFGV